MSDVVCVTSSALCGEGFFERLKRIAESRPYAVILREKQLGEEEYFRLAERAMGIFEDSGVKLILHKFIAVARSLGAKGLHLPLGELLSASKSELSGFDMLGASCHSLNDILAAESVGCTYVTLGNIFETQCKRGLEGKGLDFLRECCNKSHVPVWAIGGISPENAAEVRAAGAARVCVMGAFMKSPDVGALVRSLER